MFPCVHYAVQSQVVGMYVLHAGLSDCGLPQLLSNLDDAISDTMGENTCHYHCYFHDCSQSHSCGPLGYAPSQAAVCMEGLHILV